MAKKEMSEKDAPMLDKQAIFGANDIKTEEVFVEGWKGKVIVKGLTGNERDAWEQRIMESRKGDTGKYDLRLLKARFVIASVVDAEGNRTFSEADVEQLNLKGAKSIQTVYDVGQRLSGLSNEEADKIAGN